MESLPFHLFISLKKSENKDHSENNILIIKLCYISQQNTVHIVNDSFERVSFEKILWIKWEKLNLWLSQLHFHWITFLFISNFVFYFPPRLIVGTTLFALFSHTLVHLSHSSHKNINMKSSLFVHCDIFERFNSVSAFGIHYLLKCTCVQHRYPLNWYGDCFGVRNFEQQMNIHFKKRPMENGRRMKRTSERVNENTRSSQTIKLFLFVLLQFKLRSVNVKTFSNTPDNRCVKLYMCMCLCTFRCLLCVVQRAEIVKFIQFNELLVVNRKCSTLMTFFF